MASHLNLLLTSPIQKITSHDERIEEKNWKNSKCILTFKTDMVQRHERMPSKPTRKYIFSPDEASRPWRNYITNQEVMERSGKIDLQDRISVWRRMKIVHVLQMQSTKTGENLFGAEDGWGTQTKEQILHDLEEDLAEMVPTRCEATGQTQDHAQWRLLVQCSIGNEMN